MLNEATKKGIPYKRLIFATLTETAVPCIETGEFDGLISACVLFKSHVRPSALMIGMVKTSMRIEVDIEYIQSALSKDK